MNENNFFVRILESFDNFTRSLIMIEHSIEVEQKVIENLRVKMPCRTVLIDGAILDINAVGRIFYCDHWSHFKKSLMVKMECLIAAKEKIIKIELDRIKKNVKIEILLGSSSSATKYDVFKMLGFI